MGEPREPNHGVPRGEEGVTAWQRKTPSCTVCANMRRLLRDHPFGSRLAILLCVLAAAGALYLFLKPSVHPVAIVKNGDIRHIDSWADASIAHAHSTATPARAANFPNDFIDVSLMVIRMNAAAGLMLTCSPRDWQQNPSITNL